ncbi:transposase [Myxococcota bacterium]|nr:transposase [Myxococcota bacterium]
MKYDPEKHHRRSIRLKGYDYSRAGAYFVTLCTHDLACLFGDMVEGEMRLNDAGRMIQTVWDEIPMFYPGVDVDEFVIMPNHIHGIVVLVGQVQGHIGQAQIGQAQAQIGQAQIGQAQIGQAQIGQAQIGQAQIGQAQIGQAQGQIGQAQIGQAQGPAPTISGHIGQAQIGQAQGPAPTLSLSDVIHRFKTLTTKRYADGVKQSGWQPFFGRVWQRNYYEHIIRDEKSLARIRQYILDNPIGWAFDRNRELGG